MSSIFVSHLSGELSSSLSGSWTLVDGPYWICGWPRQRRTKFHLLLWRYYRCAQHSPPDIHYTI